MKILPTDFDGKAIRRVYDKETETWWFSVVDVIQVLTDYWREHTIANCFKLVAACAQ
ncbi:MAG: hypothetical protein ACKVOO_10125 [Burkholderiaceae bacterium]